MPTPNRAWRLPIDSAHHLVASAGGLAFVGGAGDFDDRGAIRHPGDLDAQIAGALENAAAALAAEHASLEDAVRVKAFYSSHAAADEWAVLAALARAFAQEPQPVFSLLPVPQQPFADQLVQVQIIAARGWRRGSNVRADAKPVPARYRDRFALPLSSALRAGEIVAVSNRTAADAEDRIAESDPVTQSHAIMASLEQTLAAVGASLQDSVKMEGYYFGTTRDEWRPLAEARGSHFREPGPPATVVPCHALSPEGARTKVEVLAMRASRSGFDKYIPREDRWPERVWDWPIPLPYRQAIRLRDTIWLGGQVPSEPFTNSGARVFPGALGAQTRFTMSYIEDLLRAFERGSADLKIAVCYFTSSGTPEETRAFATLLAECMGGVLPPLTLVPQPHMHTPDSTVEIWGVAQG